MKNWFSNQLEKSLALKALIMAYHRCSNREKRLLILLLIAAVIYVTLELTAMPLYHNYRQAQQKLQDAKDTYTLLAKNAVIIATPIHEDENSHSRPPAELRTVVNNTLRKTELTPEVISREGENQLRIGLSKVPYDEIAKWLTALDEENVTIISSQIQSVSPGVVNVNLVLD